MNEVGQAAYPVVAKEPADTDRVLEGEVLPPESPMMSSGKQLLADIYKVIAAIEALGRR